MLRPCFARFSIVMVSAVVIAATTGASMAAADTTTEVNPIGSKDAAGQRAESHPTLTKMAKRPPRSTVPGDRYAMAGGCYALQASNGKWVVKTGDGYAATSKKRSGAAPFHFQATELGTYLLFDADKLFVDRSSDVTGADKPSEAAEWNVTNTNNAFQIGSDNAALHVGDNGALATGAASNFALHTTKGCAEWPEVEVNVEGQPFAGISPTQEVRGYIDDHLHHMAYGFLGGGIHCGKPWDKYGVEYALRDCEDHIATGGKLALPEMVLSGKMSHDPTGWPTFKDWPAYDSLTHEGTYQKWVERAWRGGQRIMVNLLVENTVLCKLYPGPNKTCTDMDSIRTQAKETHEFENYIDAQWGGPGKGWYRIVSSPEGARHVINEGKLAVILGTETSSLFGCTEYLGIPQCAKSDIDKGLAELDELGIRQMIITHKFDNAFSGTKGDDGFNGLATNLGNFLQTGSFLRMKPCKEAETPDNEQLNASAIPEAHLAQVSELFGPLVSLPLPLALPLYTNGPHCNANGFTELGEYMTDEMIKRNLIFGVDHMSAKGRDGALDELEKKKYSGVISSHSWGDNDSYPRVYKLGGMVNPYAGDSQGFVDQWKFLQTVMDGRFYWGMGYGADMNGLGAQGAPRGADAKNPVTYPFTGMQGVKISKEQSGERTYDINVDGVAHYGLYPDWIEDLQHLAGKTIGKDLQRGPEAYLEMWERADGVTNDACRQPELRRQSSDFNAIKAGTSAKDVLAGYGQPHLRRGSTFQYCTLDGKKDAGVTVTFDGTKVSTVSTGVDAGSGDDGSSDDGAAGSDDAASHASSPLGDLGLPNLSQVVSVITTLFSDLFG